MPLIGGSARPGVRGLQVDAAQLRASLVASLRQAAQAGAGDPFGFGTTWADWDSTTRGIGLSVMASQVAHLTGDLTLIDRYRDPKLFDHGRGPGSLPPAAYTGTVTITGAGATGSPISIPVTFNVAQPQTLTAAPASLSFSYTIGLAAPQGQTVQLTSSGTNTPFTVTMKTKGTQTITVTDTLTSALTATLTTSVS